jgi:hypothetical protein
MRKDILAFRERKAFQYVPGTNLFLTKLAAWKMSPPKFRDALGDNLQRTLRREQLRTHCK